MTVAMTVGTYVTISGIFIAWSLPYKAIKVATAACVYGQCPKRWFSTNTAQSVASDIGVPPLKCNRMINDLPKLI